MKVKPLVLTLSIILLGLIGCASSQNNSSMMGIIESIDLENNNINLNVSDWENRDKSEIVDSIAYYQIIHFDKYTIFIDTNKKNININSLRVGQKIIVQSPKVDKRTTDPIYVKEIIVNL